MRTLVQLLSGAETDTQPGGRLYEATANDGDDRDSGQRGGAYRSVGEGDCAHREESE
jgi:hypothetical protein